MSAKALDMGNDGCNDIFITKLFVPGSAEQMVTLLNIGNEQNNFPFKT